MMFRSQEIEVGWSWTGTLALPTEVARQLERERDLFSAGMQNRPERGQVSRIREPESNPRNESQAWNQEAINWSMPKLQIVDSKAVEGAYEAYLAGATSYEERRRAAALIEMLRERGAYRRLVPIPSKWRSVLKDIEKTFPNFGPVLDYMRAMCMLADYQDRVICLSPILLNGAPGCGKSYFAETIAIAFGTGYRRIHMENAQSNSGLTGSADYWSNSKPGAVFDWLVQNDVANPTFILEEIDKIPESTYDPLSSLFCLLEPKTAQSFCDLSYPWVSLDASRITWICTANEADDLPESILSRLRRFNVDLPSEMQSRRIVRLMFAQLLEELGLNDSSVSLAPKSVQVLATLSPRRIRQALREGIGRALFAGRRRVLPTDVPVEQGAEEMVEPRRIGFL